jgi:hypothetical protein
MGMAMINLFEVTFTKLVSNKQMDAMSTGTQTPQQRVFYAAYEFCKLCWQRDC